MCQVVIEDVNRDGSLELIVQLSDGSVHCYDALSASLLWSRQLTPHTPSLTLDLRLVDLGNDDLQLVAATDDGSVVAAVSVLNMKVNIHSSRNQ